MSCGCVYCIIVDTKVSYTCYTLFLGMLTLYIEKSVRIHYCGKNLQNGAHFHAKQTQTS